MLSSSQLERFRADLLDWYCSHRRDLPWRRSTDAYRVWISEIMLQQTRVTAVIPYYERFLARFPDYQTLASAPEEDLLAHWAGLGYYYRARNMQKAARAIQQAGSFPADYSGVRQLPGIGDYTAAAVASISFGLPHAVVDGNVFRVLSRLCNDATNISSGQGRKHFAHLADQLLHREDPGTFNQAVMELGATICLPKNPQCLVCPVAQDCLARQNGTQDQLPVKIVAKKSAPEQRSLFWIEQHDRILVWQRPPQARLMPGFWELPECEQLPDAQPQSTLAQFRHGITFHDYRFEVKLATAPSEIGLCQWMALNDLGKLPLSTIFKKARRLVEQASQRTATIKTAAASG